MAQTIPKLIDNVDKYFQYEGSANPTTQDELQAFMKNEHSVVACLTKKLWQPETAYVQGQVIESPNIPVGFSAVALVDGTSYSNEPDWGNGTEDVTDGSIKWHLTKGNVTVNGVAPDNSGNITINKIDSASNADNATKANQDSSGQQINTTYIKSISGNSSSITVVKGDGKTSTIAIDPQIANKTFTVTASTQENRTAIVSSYKGTIDKNTTSGSGNVIDVTISFLTTTGIPKGTYTLQNLLQNLVNKSHTHSITKIADKRNCDCNCCSGDTDS